MKPEPKFFVGTVPDMMSPRTITYPCPEATSLKFDNIFTKAGRWVYVNSVDDPDLPALTKQNRTVEDEGEHWITLRPTTGEIFRHSANALKFLPKRPKNRTA